MTALDNHFKETQQARVITADNGLQILAGRKILTDSNADDDQSRSDDEKVDNMDKI